MATAMAPPERGRLMDHLRIRRRAAVHGWQTEVDRRMPGVAESAFAIANVGKKGEREVVTQVWVRTVRLAHSVDII